jgi:hypothetical protein
MELILANFLLAAAPIAAIVGDKVYWDELSQGLEHPSIVMFLISAPRGHTYAGVDALHRDRVQFDCRAATADQRRLLAEALDARLGGYRGTFEGVQFQGAFKQGHRTRSEKDGATGSFTASIDYLIVWSASA